MEKRLMQLFFMIMLSACFVVHTFSSLFVETFQRRGITPFNSGNGGNGNDPGKSPVPNREDQIFHPINSRVIRLQEPVDRPPELPSGNPIGPHQPIHTPTQEERSRLIQNVTGRRGGMGRNSDKGKGKAKVEDDQPDQKKSKKRKASEMNNDHEAGTSRAAPSPSTRTRHRSSRSSKGSGEGLAKTIGGVVAGAAKAANKVVKVANEGYRFATRTYGDIKQTCNYACRKAREGARNVRRKIRGPTPPPPRMKPLQRYYNSDSSETGIVMRNGQLRDWASPAIRHNRVKALDEERMTQTQDHPNHNVNVDAYPSPASSAGSGSSVNDYSSSSSGSPVRFNWTKSPPPASARQQRQAPASQHRPLDLDYSSSSSLPDIPLDLNHPSSSSSSSQFTSSNPESRYQREMRRARRRFERQERHNWH